ncbi:hypothetical protein ACFL6U_32890 [Planctomycetota bacterium]
MFSYNKSKHFTVSDNLFIGLRPVFLLIGLSCLTLTAQATVNVSTLLELREAVQKSDQAIVMKPGNYNLTDLPDGSKDLPCLGSNNTIDLTGVYVNIPVGTTRRAYITISGHNNIFKGGTFEDTYTSGLKVITDFSSYNKNRSTLARGLKGDAVMRVEGNDNQVIATKLIIRGSFPYGYGSIYGIGRDNVFGLDKRCGILVKGQNNTIDGCELLVMASICRVPLTKQWSKTAWSKDACVPAKIYTWKPIPMTCPHDRITPWLVEASSPCPRT